ncbi:MAG: GTPase [Clostridia bacterium]|nr:GTPase [Clostridia bacterium]
MSAKRLPKETPVYLFLGFLESGKTKFIQETMEDKRFNTGEKTLLLVCEEGELEYDASRFAPKGVEILYVDKESELTQARLTEFQKEKGIERVVVEYNGMWLLDTFFEAMPEGWAINQIMMFAQSDSILDYNRNMRQLVYDKMQYAELIVFNRLNPDKTDKMELHKLVRAISRRPDIIYEDVNGKAEFDEIEDPLPFDVNAPVVEIKDEDFALFYRDISEKLQEYEGKTVRFKGIVACDKRLKEGTFVSGRHVMTCCEDDIQYCGIVVIGDGSLPLATRDWVRVEGKIKLEKHKVYNTVGPVIYANKVVKCEKPEQELATFF